MKWFRRKPRHIPAPWMLNPEARERWERELYVAATSGVSTAELSEMMRRGPRWWPPDATPS